MRRLTGCEASKQRVPWITPQASCGLGRGSCNGRRGVVVADVYVVDVYAVGRRVGLGNLDAPGAGAHNLELVFGESFFNGNAGLHGLPAFSLVVGEEDAERGCSFVLFVAGSPQSYVAYAVGLLSLIHI